MGWSIPLPAFNRNAGQCLGRSWLAFSAKQADNAF